MALLLTGGGALAGAFLICYQYGLLPNGEAQTGMPLGLFVGLTPVSFALVIAGAAAAALATNRIRVKTAAYQLGLFGFEVPLIIAMAFGLLAWFGMRQAVIVSANEVDTQGKVESFSRLVGLFPDVGMAYYLRGERYLAQRDFERANADFDRAVELDPDFVATYLARGRVLMEQGDLEGAVADGARLIELRPDHPAGYAIRAWAEAELGDLAASGEDFNLALRPIPADAQAWDAYFVRCLALAAVEDYERAEGDCLRVLELNPDHVISLDQLALMSFNQSKYELSARYTTRVLEIEPENAAAWLNRGTAYRMMGRYEEAEADLTRAIELDPESALAFSNRAIARLYLDLKPEALADADRAVELDEAELYTRLYVARYSGENETAIEDATRLLELEGRPTPYLLSARGLAYIELGQPERGLDDLNATLRLDPAYTPGFDRRGYAYFRLGDYQRAEADFDQALQGIAGLPPQARAELHYHRALLFQAQGRLDSAREEIGEARKLVEVPDVRRAIDKLSRLLEG
jgi:tetratricopeptide (TPR) repeat protein